VRRCAAVGPEMMKRYLVGRTLAGKDCERGGMMSIRALTRAVGENLREGGAAALLGRLGAFLFTRERYVLVRYRSTRMRGSVKGSRPPVSGLTFEVVHDVPPEQVARISDPDHPQRDWPERYGLLKQRLERGEYLILGWMDGQVVWKSWICLQDWRLLTCANMSDGFKAAHCSIRCLKAFRRRGIADAALAFVEEWADKNGYGPVWGYVRQDNAASLLLHERHGFTRYGYVELYEILGRKLVRFQRPGGRLQSFARAQGMSA